MALIFLTFKDAAVNIIIAQITWERSETGPKRTVNQPRKGFHKFPSNSQAMRDLAPSSLPAQQEILRTLALLLTRDDSGVSEAVMLYLAAASRNEHFREKVGHGMMDIKPEACLILCHLLLIFSHLFLSKNNFLLLYMLCKMI